MKILSFEILFIYYTENKEGKQEMFDMNCHNCLKRTKILDKTNIKC